jgi:hypothetical protein
MHIFQTVTIPRMPRCVAAGPVTATMGGTIYIHNIDTWAIQVNVGGAWHTGIN